MVKRETILNWLSAIVGICIIIAAATGIFYTNGGERFTAVNVYGDKIEMYGDGLYAFNSVISVFNRMGADVTGIIAAAVLIALTLWKRKLLWAELVRTSVLIYLAYHSAFLVFGISMNSLYILYIICFAITLFLSVSSVKSMLKDITVPESLKRKRLTGTGTFLIIAGAITSLLWLSSIIPAMLGNTYGSLLGIQTTEVTFGIDLSITCPLLIMCGIWLLKKRDIGYKTAPFLLNILVIVAALVIFQREYCIKMGVVIPVNALIGFIVSFVIIGIVSVYLVIKLLTQLTIKNERMV